MKVVGISAPPCPPPQPTLAARDATKTIPIVMIARDKPRRERSRRQPRPPRRKRHGIRRAATGGLAGKRLELLREAVPHASHVFVIWNPGNPATAADWKETQVAARTVEVKLESVEVRGAEDFVAALPKMLARRPAAVLVIDDTLTVAYREILAEFTLKNRIPAIMARREFTEAGAGASGSGNRVSPPGHHAGWEENL